MKLKQSQRFDEFEKKIGIVLKNKRNLRLALTHASYAYQKGKKSNEILEFFGDAVLELIVREYLFKKFPKKSEGELSQLKKDFTSEESLHKIGKRMEIGKYLLMDRGEELTGGRDRPSIISSAVEALIGAIYLDRGLDCAKKFIKRWVLRRKPIVSKDYKSLLNQWAMKNKKKIHYKLLKEEGPPHKKTFSVGLYIDDRMASVGMGITKKKAEQNAARNFLKEYKD